MHGSGARLAPFDSQFVILDLPRFEHSRRCTLRHWSTGHETPKALLRLGVVGYILRMYHFLPDRSLAHAVDLSRCSINHDHSFSASDE